MAKIMKLCYFILKVLENNIEQMFLCLYVPAHLRVKGQSDGFTCAILDQSTQKR